MMECKDMIISIDKDIIDKNVYKTENDSYYISHAIYNQCGYDDTIYKRILYCPWCGQKL